MNHTTSLARAAATVAACLVPISFAAAQTLPAVTVTEAQDSYETPDISTATRTDTPFLQTPQSYQVVPQAVIQDQNAMTLAGAVRNVSGVQFDFGFNGALQPLIILRGFPSVSMSAMGSMSGASSYYLDGTKISGVPINMANVQQVEVIKGPASVLYGRAEPGGLVNVETKMPSSVSSFGFEQTIGSYGLSRTTVEATGALNADGTLLGRVAGTYFTTDSIRDFVEDRLGAFTGTISWIPNTATRINATLDYSDQHYRTDYGIPSIGNRPANLPWSTQYNDAPELSYAKTTMFKLDGYHRFNDTWKLDAKVVSVSSDTHEVDVSPYRVDLGLGMSPDQTCPGTGNPMCRYYLNVRPDGHYTMNQFNTDLVGTFNTGGVGQTVLFGLDYYTTKKTGTMYVQQLSSVDIYNPVLGSTTPLNLSLAMPNDMDDHSNWASFYVQDQLAFSNGVFLTAALRYDRTNAVYGVPGTASNDQSFTTPRLGAVWQFAPNQSVYAQYQEAVSANNGRDTVTQAALPAERARQAEVGYKVELFDRKLTSTVALYQLTKYNRASQVPIDVAPFYNFVTVGEARSRGLEWDVSGQLTQKLSIIASYAYTDGKVTRDPTYEGLLLTNVARNAGSFWARYQIDSQWSAGAGVFAQSQRQGDLGNTFQLPGYARYDGMVAYRFGWGATKSSLQFNVDNILDTKYYSSSHPWSPDWIKLGDPRTFRLTLRVDYS